MNNIDFDSFSPFWILISEERVVLAVSEYFVDISIGSNLEQSFPITSPIIKNTENIYEKLSGHIIECVFFKDEQRFRATAHKIESEILLVCWPNLTHVKQVKEKKLSKEMMHSSCYLMDTLIIKDILTKTQLKSRNNYLDKKEMEVLKKTSDRFLSNMSHEIRTPLNGILAIVQLLRGVDLPANEKKMIEIMHKSGNSLMNLINDILDFNKIENDKTLIECVDFNLEQLIDNLIVFMSYENSGTKIQLYQRKNKTADQIFKGDITKIRQVLTNFLSNALKFTENGEVSVFTNIKEVNNKYEISIGVKDTGVGINKENYKNIFAPFTQEDSSISRKFGGTGLGLNISKKLAKLMGGYVYFESSKGEGSTFYLNLTLEKGEEFKIENVKMESCEDIPFSNKLKILIVDDNMVNVKVAEMLLTKLGMKHDSVCDGLQAFEAVQLEEYSLILMDMQMPIMDGLTASEKIIEKLGEKAPPIIALTANAFNEDIDKCKNAGMADFLSKPVRIDELKKAISKNLVKG